MEWYLLVTLFPLLSGLVSVIIATWFFINSPSDKEARRRVSSGEDNLAQLYQATTDAELSADLRMTISTPNIVRVRTPFLVTMNVCNDGPDRASVVSCIIRVPANMKITKAGGGEGTVPVGRKYSIIDRRSAQFHANTIEAGAPTVSYWVLVVATASSPWGLSETIGGSVSSWASKDPDPANNDAHVGVTVTHE